MKSLEQVFDERLLSQENEMLLGNLAIVAEAHAVQSPVAGQRTLEVARMFQELSAHPVAGIIRDRDASLLAANHNLSIAQLRDFASGGRVVDVGAGKSSFLDTFWDTADTTAVDLHAEHVDYQVQRGHHGLIASASNLDGIPSGSVRLLHASYSAPFWSISPAEAIEAAHEYLRVLEPNGIALVGAMSRQDYTEHYEYVVGVHRYSDRHVLPWLDVDEAYLSHVWTAFSRTILDNRTQGDIVHGFSEVVATRSMTESEQTDDRDYETLVPDFLIIRRAA